MASSSAKIPRSKNLSNASRFIFGSQNELRWRLSKADLVLASRDQFLLCSFRTEFQDFSRLAVERFTNRFERGEADGLGLAGFEDGEILRRDVHGLGQIVQPHFALRENHIEIDDDRHKLKPSIPVPLAVPAPRGKAMP